VVRSWRRLHSEELRNVYVSPNVIRVIKSRRVRWACHVTRVREMRNVYRILVGKAEGKIPLGRTRLRWEDNNRINLEEIGWKVWNGLIWLTG
jgi:hypothetical protein